MLSLAKDLLLKYVDSNLSPNNQRFLKANGDTIITSMRVERKPLSKTIEGILNTISLGSFDSAKKNLSYDSMYHLYVVINDKFILEKNELLNFTNYSPSSNSESMDVKNIPKGLTINELVDKTRKKMGDSFIKYSAFNFNCQHFILNLLQANGLDTAELKKFILQDAKKVLEGLPSYVEDLTDNVTDIASIGRFFKEKVLGYKRGGTIFMPSNRRRRRLI
jgi:hypothetical protein